MMSRSANHPLPRALTVVLLLAVAAGLACGRDEGEGPTESTQRLAFPAAPLILISLDTLRADHLSLYGYPRPTSPRLEEFARQSVVFDRFYYNGGATLPSHMSMMTSLTPATHGVELSRSRSNVLPAARVTLAETLQAAGYATAGFTDGAWTGARFGFRQGFDLYDDSGGNLRRQGLKAGSWIEDHATDSFFLFLHTYEIHSKWRRLPYECPGDLARSFLPSGNLTLRQCRGPLCASRLLMDLDQRLESGEMAPGEVYEPEEVHELRALYDGCIRYADEWLHRFFRFLGAVGVLDRSVIVILSDHGEEFLEHGRLLHSQHGYEEVARIPLLIRLPGGRFGGARVPHLASMVDVMPTILDFLGVEIPRDVQGRTLRPGIVQGESVRDSVHMLNTLVTMNWKLLADRRELYDLRSDPDEQTNVFEQFPEIVAELTADLAAKLERDRSERIAFEETNGLAVGDTELTPEEQEELRALGYLD